MGIVLRPHWVPAYPPSGEAAPDWRGFFSLGRSFSVSSAHLEDECHLMGRDASWCTRAGMTASHGPTWPGGRSVAPGPAAPRIQLFKLVTQAGRGNGFALIAPEN